MRNVLLLTRVLLKSGSGLELGGQSKNGKKGTMSRIVLLIVLGVCMIPYIVMFLMGTYSITQVMMQTGQEKLLLQSIFTIMCMLSLTFGITYVLSQFYLSNDLERLLPLPVYPWQILTAKLVVVWLYELYSTALLALPMLIGYGAAVGWGVLNWVTAAFVFLLIPVAPLVVAAIFSIILMRLLHKVASKALISGISVVMMLIVIIPFSTMSGLVGGMGQEGAIEMFSGGTFDALKRASVIFPLNPFAEDAVSDLNMLSLLIFVAGTVLFIALFMFVGQMLYLKGVISLQEGAAKRRKMTEGEATKLIRTEAPVKALFGKEWKSLFRSPSFFLNTALVSFIWPIFMLLPFAMTALLGEEDFGALFGDIRTLLSPEVLSSEFAVLVTVLSVLGVTAFAGSMGFVSGSALSREGKSHVYIKMIPVPYRTQLTAKLGVGLIIGVITTTGYALVVLAIMMAFGLSPLTVLFAVLMSLALNVIINCIDLFADLTFPKLAWETEQEAVKQNFFLIVEMLVNFVVCGGICVLYGILAFVVGIPSLYLNLGMTALLWLLAVGFYFGTMAYGNYRLSILEA